MYEIDVPFQYVLKNFINDVYSNPNFFESITAYLDPYFGYGYYYNPGAVCDLFYKSKVQINLENPNIYLPEVSPELSERISVRDFKLYNNFFYGGDCEESSSLDGIYFSNIDELPSFYDVDGDDYQSGLFKDYEKISVTILKEGWIMDRMFFIKHEGFWYLTFFDYCDCSA